MRLGKYIVIGIAAAGLLAASPAPAQSEEAAILEGACARGDVLSCANLAILHRHGKGVPKSQSRALALFVKACEGGSEFGCGYVGEMTFLGLGINANADIGATLMRRACARGDRWTCQALRRNRLALPDGAN